jgi:hypothetical protein
MKQDIDEICLNSNPRSCGDTVNIVEEVSPGKLYIYIEDNSAMPMPSTYYMVPIVYTNCVPFCFPDPNQECFKIWCVMQGPSGLEVTELEGKDNDILLDDCTLYIFRDGFWKVKCDVTGPTGATGMKGDQGEQGPTGDVPQVYQEGTITFRQSGNLSRDIFTVEYRLEKVGRTVNLNILSPATGVNDLQAMNYLSADLVLPINLRPASFHSWSCPLVADNEDMFTHPEHRFNYLKIDNNFRFRNSTRNDGLWDNPRTFNVLGFTVSWIADA